MRRRFVFLSMDSGEPALTGMLRAWCKATGQPVGLAALRDELNANMIKQGLDPALQFGPSYFMRPGMSAPAALGRLWRRELLPMLKEHHYDNASALRTYTFGSWSAKHGLAGDTQEPLAAEPDPPSGDGPEHDESQAAAGAVEG